MLIGHFCYGRKFGIITNGLGIPRHIDFFDEDFKTRHKDYIYEDTDSPNFDKSVSDNNILLFTMIFFLVMQLLILILLMTFFLKRMMMVLLFLKKLLYLLIPELHQTNLTALSMKMEFLSVPMTILYLCYMAVFVTKKVELIESNGVALK